MKMTRCFKKAYGGSVFFSNVTGALIENMRRGGCMVAGFALHPPSSLIISVIKESVFSCQLLTLIHELETRHQGLFFSSSGFHPFEGVINWLFKRWKLMLERGRILSSQCQTAGCQTRATTELIAHTLSLRTCRTLTLISSFLSLGALTHAAPAHAN